VGYLRAARLKDGGAGDEDAEQQVSKENRRSNPAGNKLHPPKCPGCNKGTEMEEKKNSRKRSFWLDS